VHPVCWFTARSAHMAHIKCTLACLLLALVANLDSMLHTCRSQAVITTELGSFSAHMSSWPSTRRCVQAATKFAWPSKHTSLQRTPWKSASTLVKKSLAEAAKNAAGRLNHWHALDTLHNVLTQNPDAPIHNKSTHTRTLPWHSPVSPQLLATKSQHAAPAAVAAVQHQQRQAVAAAAAATAAAAAAAGAQQLSGGAAANVGLPKGLAAGPGAPAVPSPASIAATAPAAPAVDISTALMKKAEMLTRVNTISAELAHRAQERLDNPASQFSAIRFFLAVIQKAVDARKDEEWLQARLLVALLAVGGEPSWGRVASRANVEAVGYVYQLLTIKVLLLASTVLLSRIMRSLFLSSVVHS
jgi:hypothetical protein